MAAHWVRQSGLVDEAVAPLENVDKDVDRESVDCQYDKYIIEKRAREVKKKSH
jgi:hypothetical protein